MITYWDIPDRKAEAEQIKARIAEFLRETLGLELNRPRP
jgi:hypothetical protein